MTEGRRHSFSNVQNTIQIFFLKPDRPGGAGVNSGVPGSGEAPLAGSLQLCTHQIGNRRPRCMQARPPAPRRAATAVDDAAADATPGGGVGAA